MTTEEQGSDKFDAGEFYDEGVEAAGGHEALSVALDLDPATQETDQQAVEHEPAGAMSQKTKDSDEETQETEQKGDDDTAEATQAALEATGEPEETAEQAESVIAALLPQVEQKPEAESKPIQRVPVSELVKERQRRQAAEAALAERDAQEHAAAEEPVTEGKSPTDKWIEENPEDAEFSPPPAIVMAEQRKWDDARAAEREQARQKAEDETRQAATAVSQRQQDLQSLATKAETSEQAARKAHPDYEAVTKAFVENHLLTPAELKLVMADDSPSEKLYQVCKAKRDSLAGALGIETAEPTTQAPTAKGESPDESNEQMSDDQIFEDVFGS